jgi:hypothetical protein
MLSGGQNRQLAGHKVAITVRIASGSRKLNSYL